MGSFQQQLLSAMTARLQVSMCNLNVLFMLCGIFFIPEIQLLHIFILSPQKYIYNDDIDPTRDRGGC